MVTTKILLTEDNAAMSHYQQNVYLGFVSCVPDRLLPRSIYRKYFIPTVPVDRTGTALQAPLSLRAVEAALLNAGFKRKDVSVIRPDYLESRMGENTEILALSSHDPLGLGPATTTWSTIFQGTPLNRIEFLSFMKRVQRLKEKFSFKVALGGSGAWQLMNNNLFTKLGIDYLFLGEVEYKAFDFFSSILNNELAEGSIVRGDIIRPEDIPPIRGSTNWGLVEVTRGCGRGCAYCAPTTSGKIRSIPIDTIVESAKVNLDAAWNKKKVVILHSDDFFRYGTQGSEYRIKPSTIYELFESLFNVGAKSITITHASLANIVADEPFIKEFSRYLYNHNISSFGCQPGLETGSTRLMSSMMAGKAKPFSPDEWSWVVKEAMRIFGENNWHVVATLIMGLPGEGREDIIDTFKLIGGLEKFKSLYIPLFFVPMSMTRLSDRTRFISTKMTKEHWLLLERCWKHNLTHIFGLYEMTDTPDPIFLHNFLKLSIESLKILMKWKRSSIINRSAKAPLVKNIDAKKLVDHCSASSSSSSSG
ncbi:MAG: radical SAM protein [Candidatus Thorarchaeota archaeon]|nr:radical SAM protein [Candidatus Thorarchaeota archaeon]